MGMVVGGAVVVVVVVVSEGIVIVVDVEATLRVRGGEDDTPSGEERRKLKDRGSQVISEVGYETF